MAGQTMTLDSRYPPVMATLRQHFNRFHRLPAVSAASAWQELGSLEPYYSVVTNPAFLLESLTNERLQEFFASGEREVQDLLQDAQSLFHLDLPVESALDFGCGVGRLTIPLARRARHVLAVDAADSMLARARMHCCAAHLDNVEFLTLTDLSAVAPSSVNSPWHKPA